MSASYPRPCGRQKNLPIDCGASDRAYKRSDGSTLRRREGNVYGSVHYEFARCCPGDGVGHLCVLVSSDEWLP
jgi:hypothetical protein